MIKIFKNLSLFANTGIGEYGTNNISLNNIKIKSYIANELLEERALIYKENYPDCNMIIGSITNNNILNQLINSINQTTIDTGTFSPPCQGSSNLNAFKNQSNDFRNQLIKSVFQLFEKSKLINTLKLGYIENVTSYYKEEIPALIYNDLKNNEHFKLFHNYIKNNENEILNYKYFILSNNKEDLVNLINNKNIIKSELNKYLIGFNDYKEINLNKLELILKIKKLDIDITLIEPLTIKDYIEKSLELYGYKGELKNIRGEEYGAAQIRQRGFYIFYKENLKIEFPKPLYNNSKKIENYNGKTIKDVFLANDLLKIFNNIKDFKNSDYFNNDYCIKNNKIYVDTSINIDKAQEELLLWEKCNWNDNNIPNLHFKDKLKERYNLWINNTLEGTSAYKNKIRIYRPYKLIKVTKDKVFLDHSFVIKEDNKTYFKNNNILDYKDFLTKDILKEENNDKEWNKNSRKWMLLNKKVRKDLENKIIKYARKELLLKNKKYYLIFFPIKGFEGATYKRGFLNRPSNALTTKMGIGNSNTIHPIFNRVLTPAEVMVLFGLGYTLDNNNDYIKSKEYIPPKNIISIKKWRNLIYEILGEAIISTVAEMILKKILNQYIKNNKG